MKNKTRRNLFIFGTITLLILTIPLVAMQYTNEVNWTIGDFIFAGVLLFGSGAFYEFVSRNMQNPRRKLFVGLVVIFFVLLVWAGAATGE